MAWIYHHQPTALTDLSLKSSLLLTKLDDISILIIKQMQQNINTFGFRHLQNTSYAFFSIQVTSLYKVQHAIRPTTRLYCELYDRIVSSRPIFYGRISGMKFQNCNFIYNIQKHWVLQRHSLFNTVTNAQRLSKCSNFKWMLPCSGKREMWLMTHSNIPSCTEVWARRHT